MNCKPGDVAVIKRPYNIDSEIGRIVSVVRQGIYGETRKSRGGSDCTCSGPGGENRVGWLCDASGSDYPCFIADDCLRPIRDNPGADETLSWRDVPQKVTA